MNISFFERLRDEVAKAPALAQRAYLHNGQCCIVGHALRLSGTNDAMLYAMASSGLYWLGQRYPVSMESLYKSSGAPQEFWGKLQEINDEWPEGEVQGVILQRLNHWINQYSPMSSDEDDQTWVG